MEPFPFQERPESGELPLIGRSCPGCLLTVLKELLEYFLQIERRRPDGLLQSLLDAILPQAPKALQDFLAVRRSLHDLDHLVDLDGLSVLSDLVSYIDFFIHLIYNLILDMR